MTARGSGKATTPSPPAGCRGCCVRAGSLLACPPMLLLPQLGDNPEAVRLPVGSESGMRGVFLGSCILVSCIAVSCAHTAPTASPPPLTGWRELRSEHFRLRTDLPEDAARETLRK